MAIPVKEDDTTRSDEMDSQLIMVTGSSKETKETLGELGIPSLGTFG